MESAGRETLLQESAPEKRAAAQRLSRFLRAIREPAAVSAGVITVFWKLALTKQYTFLNSPDLVNEVLPRLQAAIFALRHWSILLWNPYEFFGQPPIGQVEPAIVSPFTFLLAPAPLHNGHIQFFYVHLWFVLMHCIAGIFAWRFFRELGCSAGPAVLGGVLCATMGFFGNTEWPNHLQPALVTPLVFLFLLRSLRGRAPLKNAAWAGVALGFAWTGGHHDPALMMTYAVAAIGLVAAARRSNRVAAASRMLILFAVMALVSAVQMLPALEYGRLSTRWTETGAKVWGQRVPFTEHEQFSLKPADLIHVPIIGGRGSWADPFVGIAALSLAAIAIWSGIGRKEVRLFIVLGIGALLYAMAGSDALYGPLYAVLPLVEKTREPIVAVFLFQFAVAALAAMGAEVLLSQSDMFRERRLARTLYWFGAAIFGFVFVLNSIKPAIGATTISDADSRPVMTAVISVMLAAVYQALSHDAARRRWGLAFIGLLLVVEQGNEVSWTWQQLKDPKQVAALNALNDTQDLGDWLRRQPSPKRIEKNDKDVPFDFGDWYRLDSGNSYGASMLSETVDLGGWWQPRIGRMYGLNYALSRTPPVEGFEEVFTGRTGIKIWHDPGAFPRAWTVHQIVVARNDRSGIDMMNNGTFDLRTTALTVRSKPALETCGDADKVTRINDQTESLRVDVEMACKGLLVVSDNFYPGWRAAVDGKSVEIWKVNTAIRGVIVPPGRHVVTMNYRPFSVYFGFLCTLAGVALAVVLQRRRESDGVDLL